jgi:osmotically-inducible protein OsmY
MKNLKLGWSMVGVVATLAFGCSHEDRTDEHARRDRTSGDEARDHRSDSDVERDAERTAARADRATDDTDDAPTAMDQSNDSRDLEITQAIRVAVVGDDSLSFTARNCTIVTVAAVVTLRGDVNTADERAAIERHARAVDGVARVDNLLAVSP